VLFVEKNVYLPFLLHMVEEKWGKSSKILEDPQMAQREFNKGIDC
jgi:hypothetical protein